MYGLDLRIGQKSAVIAGCPFDADGFAEALSFLVVLTPATATISRRTRRIPSACTLPMYPAPITAVLILPDEYYDSFP